MRFFLRDLDLKEKAQVSQKPSVISLLKANSELFAFDEQVTRPIATRENQLRRLWTVRHTKPQKKPVFEGTPDCGDIKKGSVQKTV